MLPRLRGRSVAVLGTADMSAFELGVACEVFGTDRSDRCIPLWDFALCLDAPARSPPGPASRSTAAYGLDRLAGADLVIVPNWPDLETPPGEPILAALRAAYGRGAWVLGFCSGTFALAYAGLLEGRRATTHWNYADRFRALFPAVELDPDVLYVADDAVMTSAGTSAAVDLSLQVLREVDGPRSPTRWPAGWWCRRTATADRPSSSSTRCRPTATTTWPTCWPGWPTTSPTT